MGRQLPIESGTARAHANALDSKTSRAVCSVLEIKFTLAILLLLSIAPLWPTSRLGAQPRDLPPVESKRFKRVLEYHDPPHERQTKYMLEGASAHTLPDGKLLITNGRVQAFAPTGELQAIGEAPEGIYDPKAHVVYSSGPFKVWTLDGAYYGEGRGYLWQMTNSLLFITNHERVDFADIAKKR